MSVERSELNVDRSAPSGAVFLSYAREDTDAARRIADALRSRGVEVWFDQSELRGGDAWDAKIRRQINDCALFLPIISRHTQERGKGYFRLEWKLAVEQTYLLAEGIPFLAPVVVDDTSEDGAMVPAEFMKVQWTRLPGALPTPQFVEHVKHLLESPGKTTLEAGRPRPAPRDEGVASPGKVGRRVPAAAWLLALAVTVIALAMIWWRKPGTEPNAGAGTRPPAVETPAASPIDAKSIAVLPFDNLSDDKDNAFFADGVHEDILTDLANLGGLKVISRTSVIQYRGTKKPIRQIGEELGVAFILEGSVRRAGNKVRVTGQLINARTDEHVWAKTYDRDMTDIFAIQGELATAIARALHAAITPQEQATLAAQPTANLPAYELYKLARFKSQEGFGGRDQIDEIMSLLESAVQLDPKFVDAWAELARQRLAQYHVGGALDQLARAREALDTAGRLAPDAFSVLQTQRLMYYYFDNVAERVKVSERIARLYPNRAETRIIMASEAWFGSRWQEALDEVRRAVRLDPRGLDTLNFAMVYLLALRRYDEGEALSRVAFEVHPPTPEMRFNHAFERFVATGSKAEGEALLAALSPEALRSDRRAIAFAGQWSYFQGDAATVIRLWQESGANWRFSNQDARYDLLSVATCYCKLGQRSLALPLLQKNRDLLQAQLANEPDHPLKWDDLALTLALLGEKDGADRALARLRDLIAATVNQTHKVNLQMDMACTLGWLGRKTEAINLVASTINRPALYYPARMHTLRHSVAWWPLQGDPRFDALVNDPKNNEPLF